MSDDLFTLSLMITSKEFQVAAEEPIQISASTGTRVKQLLSGLVSALHYLIDKVNIHPSDGR